MCALRVIPSVWLHVTYFSAQIGAVAFSVARTTELEVTEITAIEYDIIEVNIGSGIDSINKKHFTAPVNGYYSTKRIYKG